MVETARLVEWPQHDTPDGRLRVMEFRALPFSPERDFLITAVPDGTVRGGHAHRTCHQFFRAFAGACALSVWAPGRPDDPFTHVLSVGSHGVWVPPRRWVEVVAASETAVLHCLASHPYDAADYLHSRAEFDRLSP